MFVIGRDINAQIGKNGNNKYSLHNTSNRNGQHVTDFMIENRLSCLNTNYQKREGKLWTYTYTNNRKAQIDYVLINKKWKNSAMNSEAYSSFEGVSSDHWIVTTKIRLSLRENAKRTATTKHYDWARLNNRDIRDKYVLELKNRFETLQEKTEKSTPNDEYENFVNAHLEAAAKCIPTKLKTKYWVPWETLAVREKRALVKTASKNYRKNPTNTNAQKLKTAQYHLAGIYIKEQTEYIQNQIDKIRDSVEDRQSRIAWQTINDNILRKNQNGFRRNRSTTSQILTIRRILEDVQAKNLQTALIFVDFTKAFDSIHWGKMEQILLAYGIPKETVGAITILYKNTIVKVRSPVGDTEYFDIVAGVLQGDMLAPYLFIICLDYVLRTSIDKIRENGFELTKKRSRRYPAKAITDADYADDIVILANTPNQAKTLLHSLEWAAAGISLFVNAHKTKYMCYDQTGDISTQDGIPLKLVDKFTYLGSSVASTEKDINTRLTKAIDYMEIRPNR